MRLRFVAPLALMSLCTVVLAAEPAPAKRPPSLTAEECAVWQRELSFADSVATHDAERFATHVSENAAFGASTREPTRGREAIAQRWAGIVEGKRMALRWYPTRVTMAPGVSDIAWSSGPSLFESLDPAAKQRYHVGAFHSVWHKDADGVWRVLFDDGVDPHPASPEEVAAFEAGRMDCAQDKPNRS